jgi:hypothetical protein
MFGDLSYQLRNLSPISFGSRIVEQANVALCLVMAVKLWGISNVLNSGRGQGLALILANARCDCRPGGASPHLATTALTQRRVTV